MSSFLHLRAFTGRSAAIADQIAGHAINPALQPVLSRIPALTLADSYRLDESYDYGKAFSWAAIQVLGPDLAGLVKSRLSAFQDVGLEHLGDGVARLKARFASIDHPGAREIVAWLDGTWTITREELEAS